MSVNRKLRNPQGQYLHITVTAIARPNKQRKYVSISRPTITAADLSPEMIVATQKAAVQNCYSDRQKKI